MGNAAVTQHFDTVRSIWAGKLEIGLVQDKKCAWLDRSN